MKGINKAACLLCTSLFTLPTTALLGPIGCTTESQPNPIASQYPSDTTGTANGTTIFIPIPLSYAQSLIPKGARILLDQLYTLQPDFPADKFPLLVQGVYDHDILTNGLNLVADFSRVEVNLPFVDIFGDSHTSFRYAQSLVISNNALAIVGAQPYYTPPSPIVASFDPPCDAYRADPAGPSGSILFDALPLLPGNITGASSPLFKTRFESVDSQPYSLELYRNTSNQIITNGKLCDNFTTIFDSAVTTGKYAPVPIRGSVSIGKPALPSDMQFEGVFGLKADFAFIEHNYLPCDQFRS